MAKLNESRLLSALLNAATAPKIRMRFKLPKGHNVQTQRLEARSRTIGSKGTIVAGRGRGRRVGRDERSYIASTLEKLYREYWRAERIYKRATQPVVTPNAIAEWLLVECGAQCGKSTIFDVLTGEGRFSEQTRLSIERALLKQPVFIAGSGRTGRIVLSDGFLRFEPDNKALLAGLVGLWKDEDVWDRGEQAYQQFSQNATEVLHGIEKVLFSCWLHEQESAHTLRLLRYVSEAAGVIHMVTDAQYAGELVSSLVVNARSLADRLQAAGGDDSPEACAQLNLALGRLHHNQSIGAVAWARTQVSPGLAEAMIVPLARAKGHYSLAEQLFRHRDPELARACRRHMWTQDFAEARVWERAGEVGKAKVKLLDARRMRADNAPPVLVGAEWILDAKLLVRNRVCGMSDKLRALRALEQGRRILVDGGLGQHHMSGAAALLHWEIDPASREARDKGVQIFESSVIVNHWMCDLPSARRRLGITANGARRK